MSSGSWCYVIVITGVSGWIGERKDYLKIWSTLEAPDSEVFSLVWESKALLALNSAIGSFMAQQAYQEVAKWAITHVSDSPISQLFLGMSGGSAWAGPTGNKEKLYWMKTRLQGWAAGGMVGVDESAVCAVLLHGIGGCPGDSLDPSQLLTGVNIQLPCPCTLCRECPCVPCQILQHHPNTEKHCYLT